MTLRTPSHVPFVTLFLVAVLLLLVVPRVLPYANLYWAGGLMLGCLLLASATILIGGGPGYSSTLPSALWLIPALIFTNQNSLVGLVCLIPMLAGLNQYLPGSEAPQARGLIAALLIQGAIAIHLSSPAVLALVPAALGIALILWAKEIPPRPRDFRLASGLTAAMLTLFLLSPAAPRFPGSSGQATPLVPPPAESNAGSSSNAHLGIILRPKVETQDHKLPPPPKIQPAVVRAIPKIPMEIPFSGVYWLFQIPLMRPPANSPVLDESPIDGDFSSDQLAPLRLDAHQTFNQPFPMGRIESIGVTLSSRDKYPTTLSLQLVASTSKTPQYKVNLGEWPIDSLALTQSLRFKVPASPYIDAFDQLTLRFRLTFPRLHIAPRIAINKFTIYPR